MRRFLLFSMLFVTTLSVRPQAVLEHEFDNDTWGAWKLNTLGWVWVTQDTSNNPKKFYLLSESYNLIKTINLVVPAKTTQISLTNISDKLFNNDDKIEVLYLVTMQTGTTFSHKLMLIDENSTVLQEFPDEWFASIFQVDGHYKLKLYFVNKSGSEIYTLPGSMDGINVTVNENSFLKAYPDPATSYVELTYPPEAKELEISSLQGIFVRRIDPDGSGKTWIDTRSLEPGLYVYRVLLPDGRSRAGKFVVCR
jgi:hypothetical protein